MLARSSEEGKLKGLGWIDAIVKGLTLLMTLFCLMGWNNVNPKSFDGLYKRTKEDLKFYFYILITLMLLRSLM